MMRAMTAARASSRMREDFRCRMRGRPRMSAMPSAAATWPCGKGAANGDRVLQAAEDHAAAEDGIEAGNGARRKVCEI